MNRLRIGNINMRPRLLLLVFLPLGLASSAFAQPTYKLGVDAHVFPSAVLRLDGSKMTRSKVKDDPGFKLRFHVLKDGKSLQTADARAAESFDLPTKEKGTYAAVLELFYPAYKPGKEQKGQFKAISDYLVYHVISPGAPIKLLARKPALTLECGKGEGKGQEVTLAKDYGYKLVQGKPLDTWPPTAAKSHAWTDPKQVKFEITLPKETPGTLRLHLVDGDGLGRKCKVVIQGRPVPLVEGFAAGKRVEFPLSIAETKTGKIEVMIESTDAKMSAVVSGVEFVPASGGL